MATRERLICDSAALSDGGAGVRFEVTRAEGLVPAFAVRYQGQVRAYLNRCTHVPVEIDWQNGKFFDYSGLYLVCATHGALYAPENGRCMGGRCNGRGLTGVPVVERDGGVYLIESE